MFLTCLYLLHPSEELDPLEPDIIQRLENLYQYNAISTDYYTDVSVTCRACVCVIIVWLVVHFVFNSKFVISLILFVLQEEGDEKHLKRLLNWYFQQYKVREYASKMN
jgi:hypothetical protein